MIFKVVFKILKSLLLFLTLGASNQIDVINFLHDRNLEESHILLQRRKCFLSSLAIIFMRNKKVVISLTAAMIKDLVDKLFHKEILRQYILKRFTALEISLDICYSRIFISSGIQSIKMWSVYEEPGFVM